MTRRLRRLLDRRADRALQRARGALVALDPTRDLVLVREDDDVRVLAADIAPTALALLGLRDLHIEIEAAREERAHGWVPAIVLISGHATGRWIESHRLCRGGAA